MAKDILIKVKIDAGEAQQQLQNAVQEIEQNPVEVKVNIPVEGSIAQLKALKKELRNTAAGSEEFNKLFNQIDDLEEKLGAANKASSDWIDTLAGAGGSLGALGQGLNKGKEAFSSFNNILKTSIIGIIVTAVTLLYQAFNKNKEAQEKLQPVLTAFDKILGGVFRAAEPLLDLFVSLAEKVLPIVASAIGNVAAFVGGLVRGFGVLGDAIKELFQGNLTKAIDTAKGSTKAFSDGFTETKNKFVAGTKEMTDKEVEENEKRKKAAEEAAAKRKAQLEKNAAEAEKIAKKNADEIARIEKEKNDRIRGFAEEAQDKENKIIAEINKAKIANAEFGKSTRQQEIDAENRKYEELLKEATAFGLNSEALTIQHNNNIAEINKKADKEDKEKSDKIAEDKKKADKEEKDNAKSVTEAKIAFKNQELDAANALVGIAKSLGEKNKGIQASALVAESAIGIAKIIINTQAANAAATLKYSLLPGGTALAATEIALNKVSAGIGIAANLAATGKALSALGKGAATGGGSTVAGGGGGGGVPTLTPQANLFASNTPNGNTNIPQTTPNINNNVVVKAFVSETEITQTQQFVKKAEESAKI